MTRREDIPFVVSFPSTVLSVDGRTPSRLFCYIEWADQKETSDRVKKTRNRERRRTAKQEKKKRRFTKTKRSSVKDFLNSLFYPCRRTNFVTLMTFCQIRSLSLCLHGSTPRPICSMRRNNSSHVSMERMGPNRLETAAQLTEQIPTSGWPFSLLDRWNDPMKRIIPVCG